MPVDESRTRKFNLFEFIVCAVPSISEAFLMMVETQLFWDILSSHIDYNIECIKYFLIACSHNKRVCKLLCVLQHSACEYLITMKSVAVRTDHFAGISGALLSQGILIFRPYHI